MSPSQFHNNTNNDIQSHAYWSSPLKINEASHTIKKSSSPSASSSSSSSLANVLPKPPSTPPSPPPPQQQRLPPVIIYTHAPKVIRTTPCNFMALVQRLTGLSSSVQDDDDSDSPAKPETTGDPSPPASEEAEEIDGRSNKIAVNNDENESSSVTTEENVGKCSNNVGDGQVNSCFVSSHQPNPCGLMSNVPVFKSKPADIFCPNQPFCNYNNSFLFAGASMRTPVPTTASSKVLVEGVNEFRAY